MLKNFIWKTRREEINNDFILRLDHNVMTVSELPPPTRRYIYLVVFYVRSLSLAENTECLTLRQSMNSELERVRQEPVVA
jgi:hypothetical protein